MCFLRGRYAPLKSDAQAEAIVKRAIPYTAPTSKQTDCLVKRALAAGLALAVSTLGLAHDAPAMRKPILQQFTTIADNMCLRSVATSPSSRAGHLEDNRKLADYCKCSSDMFYNRANKLLQGTMAGRATQESLEGQRAVRNTCLTQMASPQIEFKP